MEGRGCRGCHNQITSTPSRSFHIPGTHEDRYVLAFSPLCCTIGRGLLPTLCCCTEFGLSSGMTSLSYLCFI
jgi:hypothetical protein